MYKTIVNRKGFLSNENYSYSPLCNSFTLRDPFVISYGSYFDMPSIIVKMETDEGIIGYGEGVADDHVTGESWESTFHTLKHTLAPALISQNPMNIEKYTI